MDGGIEVAIVLPAGHWLAALALLRGDVDGDNENAAREEHGEKSNHQDQGSSSTDGDQLLRVQGKENHQGSFNGDDDNRPDREENTRFAAEDQNGAHRGQIERFHSFVQVGEQFEKQDQGVGHSHGFDVDRERRLIQTRIAQKDQQSERIEGQGQQREQVHREITELLREVISNGTIQHQTIRLTQETTHLDK